MNCNQIIEKLLYEIINRNYQVYKAEILDDTEYIRDVKMIIDGAENFFAGDARKSIDEFEKMKERLYIVAKDLWKDNLPKEPAKENTSSTDTVDIEESEYLSYYYDYIYDKGVYPR